MTKSCKAGRGALRKSAKAVLSLGIAATIQFCPAARATQSVTVAWNPGTDPGIAGYTLYCGTTNGNYSTNINVGTNTSVVVSGLVPGQTNYFAVAAYNVVNLQGTNSPVLTYIVPGCLAMNTGSNGMMSFPVSPGHWYAVQASTNLVSWTNIWQSATESSNVWISYADPQASAYARRFYRLVLH